MTLGAWGLLGAGFGAIALIVGATLWLATRGQDDWSQGKEE